MRFRLAIIAGLLLAPLAVAEGGGDEVDDEEIFYDGLLAPAFEKLDCRAPGADILGAAAAEQDGIFVVSIAFASDVRALACATIPLDEARYQAQRAWLYGAPELEVWLDHTTPCANLAYSDGAWANVCGEFVDLGERVEWRVPVRGIVETSLGPRAFDLDAPAHALDVASFLGGPTDPSSQTWYSAGDRLVVE